MFNFEGGVGGVSVFICIPHTQGQPKGVLFLNVLLCAQ